MTYPSTPTRILPKNTGKLSLRTRKELREEMLSLPWQNADLDCTVYLEGPYVDGAYNGIELTKILRR